MNQVIEAFTGAIENVLDSCDIAKSDREALLELASGEAAPAMGASYFITAPVAPACFGEYARAIRRSGEMPVYLAKIAALWLKANRSGEINADGIRKTVEKECGINFEREFIQLVAESFEALPDLGLDGKSVDKVRFMKRAYRGGYEYERIYRGCAQCTMAAVSDVTGRENAEMFRAANGLAAGMAQLGDGVCGGYSGGLLSIGMFAGRRREFFDGDKEQKDLNALLAGKLHDKFIETYGTVICHGIHNEIFGRAFHITKPDEKEEFEKSGAHTLDKCPAVVGTAAAWTAEILYDYGFTATEDK